MTTRPRSPKPLDSHAAAQEQHHQQDGRALEGVRGEGVVQLILQLLQGHRVGTDDPSIRLACQLRPTGDLTFFQLFLPQSTSAHSHASNPARIGQERYLVSLFVDMRGSTKLAEKRLPFDTVFIVNRFLGAVSQAVLEAGGRPNQFIGDGSIRPYGEMSVGYRRFGVSDSEFGDGSSDMIFGSAAVGLDFGIGDRLSIFAQAGYGGAYSDDFSTYGPEAMFGLSVRF